MRKTGAKSDFTNQRDRELWACYTSALYTASFIRLPDIWGAVAAMPCSRLWISEERATAVVWAARLGRDPAMGMRPAKSRQYAELLRRVGDHMARGMSLQDAVWEAVHEPAEEFYLSPGAVRIIIYEIKRRKRAKKP